MEKLINAVCDVGDVLEKEIRPRFVAVKTKVKSEASSVQVGMP